MQMKSLILFWQYYINSNILILKIMNILTDYDKTQLRQYITEKYRVKPFVADQIFGWVLKGADFHEMTNVSLALREKLSADNLTTGISIIDTRTSAVDGTQKFLYRLWDGNVIEGVLMKYKWDL